MCAATRAPLAPVIALVSVVSVVSAVSTGACGSSRAPASRRHECGAVAVALPRDWRASAPIDARAAPDPADRLAVTAGHRLASAIDPRAPRGPDSGARASACVFAAPGRSRAVEVRRLARPRYGGWRAALALVRRVRFGPGYAEPARPIAVWLRGRRWYRTGFRDRAGRGVEYATDTGDHLVVVTLYGSSDLAAVDAIVASSLRLSGPLAEPDGAAPPSIPDGADAGVESPPAWAIGSTAAVLALDTTTDSEGWLGIEPVAGGSGVVVANGQILTSLHILRDPATGRWRDGFAVGLASGVGALPAFACAGRPERARADAERDLALIRCEVDLQGEPTVALAAPMAPAPARAAPAPGTPLWIVGYSQASQGALGAVPGRVVGTTGANGGPGADYVAAFADVTYGHSGGAAVTADGAWFGVVAGFRVRVETAPDGTVRVRRLGLVQLLDATSLELVPQ